MGEKSRREQFIRGARAGIPIVFGFFPVAVSYAIIARQAGMSAAQIGLMCLTFTYRSEDKLTHRDFLGSFMAQQLRREVIGDIVVGEGVAQAFVTDVAARLIGSSVTKIGRVGVKLTDDEPFRLENAQKFQEISGTVASLRLDCAVGLAAHLSREKAAVLIRSDKVDVNHFTVSSVSHELKEGDILSVRGCGRFVLSRIDGSTKKGRIHINLRKYI